MSSRHPVVPADLEDRVLTLYRAGGTVREVVAAVLDEAGFLLDPAAVVSLIQERAADLAIRLAAEATADAAASTGDRVAAAGVLVDAARLRGEVEGERKEGWA